MISLRRLALYQITSRVVCMLPNWSSLSNLLMSLMWVSNTFKDHNVESRTIWQCKWWRAVWSRMWLKHFQLCISSSKLWIALHFSLQKTRTSEYILRSLFVHRPYLTYSIFCCQRRGERSKSVGSTLVLYCRLQLHVKNKQRNWQTQFAVITRDLLATHWSGTLWIIDE